MRTAIGYAVACATREVGHGAGNEHVARTSQSHDASADHHGDAAEVLAHLFALTEMDPGPDLDTELADRFGGCARAGDRRRGFAERREEPIAGGVDLAATEPLQLTSHDPVVPRRERLPAAIAQFLGNGGRVHHVGEEHGGQDPP